MPNTRANRIGQSLDSRLLRASVTRVRRPPAGAPLVQPPPSQVAGLAVVPRCSLPGCPPPPTRRLPVPLPTGKSPLLPPCRLPQISV
ncbi:hypothetical protein BRADI_3g22036v3 [Brachypodium distachyon]|uniref:Uncharacterized protein n=1 Tax=Brachypodium distachyon TaxID=15368 RepID=A0A0Q3JD52_BRADI|nr:hypothetical protein BRADI_3g22036v3 [Brachypodium distachyon]